MPEILDGKYRLGKLLGEGGFCRVHEAIDKDDGTKYAVKTWIKFQQKMFNDEALAAEIPEHPHLVNYIKSSKHGQIVNDSSGKTREVAYILMEHVSGGELLDTLMDHGGFSEEIARYYFKQLLIGLNQLHQSGVAHRDLKPENILFTAEDYDIKITDFGFLIPLEGRDRTAWLQSRVGTLTYMAPEVLAKESYLGKTIDLYSLGVILFVMYLGNMPMENACSSDRYFKCLSQNKTDTFWKSHQQNVPDFQISDDFKSLITMMIHPNPQLRLDMADIVCHPWMQGPIASQSEVVAEMERRKAASKKMSDEARAGSSRPQEDGSVYRDFQLDNVTYVVDYKNDQEADDKNIVKLEIAQMQPEDERLNKLQTNLAPDDVFNQVGAYLKDQDMKNLEMKDGEWKLEFEQVKIIKLGDDDEETKEGDDQEDTLKEVSTFALKIVQADGKRYLTFDKKTGSIFVAREIWTGIQENIRLLE